jgi:hypothetical protein
MIVNRDDFIEDNNLKSNTVAVRLWKYRKANNGKNPKWYISSKLVDTDEFFKITNLSKRAWVENTEVLYLILKDIIGMSSNKLSKILATKSDIYKSYESWNDFICHYLYNPPSELAYVKYSRTFEFFKLAIITIAIWIKDNKHTKQYEEILALNMDYFN